ncbi:MAG: LacI family DNA-binding transcriptional regulator [Lacrimispora sp.]|uniref:LacI family DNA-binding transcriptional regulator n=1 Tax=Lacrimispora sp. TaxID=2719234 RepID=UPI0039E5215F
MGYTIKDVAIRANVSSATVSRVMNNKGYFSDSVRKRVLDAIEELDYTPNLMASSLSKNRVKIIGVIVPDICNTFFSKIFYAASKLAEQNDYRVILYNTDDNMASEMSALQDMISYRVSGIIMTPVSDQYDANAELLNNIQSSGVPVVFVDREMKGVSCDGVFVDNIRSSYEATERLLQEGHRKIAIVAGPQDTIPGRERMLGYMNALRDWGVQVPPEYITYGDFKTDKSYQVMMELMESEDPPTAVFSCNNLMTLGCIQAIRTHNKRIPDEISLVGFDEVELLDVLGYQITVVSRAISEMGTIAMQLVLDRIVQEKQRSYQRVVLQSQLLLKGSERMGAVGENEETQWQKRSIK